LARDKAGINQLGRQESYERIIQVIKFTTRRKQFRLWT